VAPEWRLGLASVSVALGSVASRGCAAPGARLRSAEPGPPGRKSARVKVGAFSRRFQSSWKGGFSGARARLLPRLPHPRRGSDALAVRSATLLPLIGTRGSGRRLGTSAGDVGTEHEATSGSAEASAHRSSGRRLISAVERRPSSGWHPRPGVPTDERWRRGAHRLSQVRDMPSTEPLSLLLLLALAVPQPASGYAVLLATMGGTRSHTVPFVALGAALAGRGHNVSLASGFPGPAANGGLRELVPPRLEVRNRSLPPFSSSPVLCPAPRDPHKVAELPRLSPPPRAAPGPRLPWPIRQ
jgi:hypothetical protein